MNLSLLFHEFPRDFFRARDGLYEYKIIYIYLLGCRDGGLGPIDARGAWGFGRYDDDARAEIYGKTPGEARRAKMAVASPITLASDAQRLPKAF